MLMIDQDRKDPDTQFDLGMGEVQLMTGSVVES